LISLRSSSLNYLKDNSESLKIGFSLLRSNLLNVLGEVEKYIAIVNPPVVKALAAKPFVILAQQMNLSR
jgi:hypothetical protein